MILRIVAHLSAPVVLTDDLHMDGILLAAHPDTRGAERLVRASPDSVVRTPPLPVVRHTYSDATCYLCSAAVPDPSARRRSDSLTRRRDGADIDHLAGKVQTRVGAGRDVMLRYPVLDTPTLTWYAIGDRRGVRYLLRYVDAVGGRRRSGYGAVARWEIERLRDADPLTVLLHAGRAYRHLPASWCDAPASVDRGAVRPPYWHPSTHAERVRCGTATGLLPHVVAGVCSCH